MIRLCAFADEADTELDGQIDALVRNGIDLLELRAVFGINISDMSLSRVREIKKQLDENDIRVWSLGSPFGKVSLDESFKEETLFDQLKNLCEKANILCTDKIRIFSFYSAYDKREYVIELLRRAVSEAAEYGIGLFHENEKNIYGDLPERVFDLYENVPGLHFVYDPANYVQCGVTPSDHFERLKTITGYYHIKDCISATGEIVPSGYGDGDIRGIISSIGRDEDKVLTLEPHLAVFKGYSEIDPEKLKNKFEYKNNNEAFDAACVALCKMLQSENYTKKGKNIWTLD